MNGKTLFSHLPEPTLRDQYIKLRQRTYLVHYPCLSSTFGLCEPDDYLGDIVVAHDGDTVLGGARLNWTAPAAPRALPLESRDFRLAEIAPELCGAPYGEISRYAVTPEASGDGAVGLEIARAMCSRATARGIATLFSMCPPAVARLNRRNAKLCGVGFVYFAGLTVPNPFGLQMTLCAYTNVGQYLSLGAAA